MRAEIRQNAQKRGINTLKSYDEYKLLQGFRQLDNHEKGLLFAALKALLDFKQQAQEKAQQAQPQHRP